MLERFMIRAATTSLFLLLLGLLIWVASAPVDATMERHPQALRPPADWMPPDWFPAGTELDSLALLEQRGPSQGPSLRSPSALVFDMDAGQVLYAKNADNIQPVASLTKLVSALTLVSAQPDLDRTIEIAAQHYPTRNGALSKLWTDDRIVGWDALGAALVSSDNRGAFALASAAGMDLDPFVARMNQVSGELRMDLSSWSEPSGLEDENMSTARDMARATLAVASHPLLSSVASAPYWDLRYQNRPLRRVRSTNRLLGRSDLLTIAAKTGFTNTAGYCFSTALQTSEGRRLVITLLGAQRKTHRYLDVNRILRWVQS